MHIAFMNYLIVVLLLLFFVNARKFPMGRKSMSLSLTHDKWSVQVLFIFVLVVVKSFLKI